MSDCLGEGEMGTRAKGILVGIVVFVLLTVELLIELPPVGNAHAMDANDGFSSIEGTVTDIHGSPLPGAIVTIEGKTLGYMTLSVFTDASGKYRTPDLGRKVVSSEIRVHCRKLGFNQADPGQLRSVSNGGILQADFRMMPKTNVASQVPPSAWLERLNLPQNGARERTVLVCADCHEFPNPETKRFVSSLASLPSSQRRKSWEGVADLMNQHVIDFARDWGMGEGIFAEPGKSKPAFVSSSDRKLVVPFLAKYFPPYRFLAFPFTEWQATYHHVPLGTRGTVIKEYLLPVTDSSWTREVVVPRSSPYVWGVDKPNNKLFRLDKGNGSVKWYVIPSKNTGPHSMFLDSDNNIWISLEEAGALARFSPGTEEWKIFPNFAKDGKLFLTHDIAHDFKREVIADTRGRVWNTLPSVNKLGGINPNTGALDIADVPLPENQSPGGVVLYGCVMASDHTHIWYAQLRGDIGSFNTETGKFETILHLPEGSGPRRPTIDDKDILWVPLFGAGQIMAYDTRALKELATYDLPDRSSAPYALTWDPVRKAIWVATMNNGAIYRFSPGTNTWVEYEMPRTNARFRMLVLDDAGNVWGTYGTFPGLKGRRAPSRSSMVMMLMPGEPD